ncbi:MAG: Hsp33 family molecular chaperone HslO [Proteobacteria bacterium]|nr:MAG: Hsp33 family molecular chaperone HslO [Pseudomonadota bacterium]
MKQKVHRFVSDDFTLRIAAVDSTEVVAEMQRLQKTFPLPTVAVGRAMTGALLLASHLKDGQKVGLYFKGNGPLTAVYAEANFEGQVRGYSPVPIFEPANYDKGLSLREHMGEGLLTVTRHLPFQKEPHNGTVEMVSGEIGEDIAHYLVQSHQIRSIVSLGVYLDTYGQVKAAGGVILEVMPGVEESVVDRIQKNAEAFKENISKMLLTGATPIDLVRPFMEGVPFTELEHEHTVEYYCPCTKDRVVAALELLGVEELEDMIQKQEPADVVCQMCGRPYQVPVDELRELKSRLSKESLH